MRQISFEIRSFLKENIQSVWQLDLLIAMMALKEARDIHALARSLYLTPSAVKYAVEQFVKSGLVKEFPGRSSTYLFAPRSESNLKLLEDTVKLYSFRRVEIINLIFSNPPKQTYTG